MSRCDIFLDNYVNGYKSGQNIVGRVHCTFTDEKTVKGLIIQFKGTAKTHWSETERHTRRDPITKKNKIESRIVHYGAEENVLNHEINLLPRLVLRFKGTAKTHWTETESSTSHDSNTNTSRTETREVSYGAEENVLNHEINLLPQAEQIIPAGVHSYPFSYVLPPFIPSSFDGQHGKIVYKVKATVQRSFLKMNYEAESPINIVGVINLNDNSTLSNPIIQRKEKNVGCCCWTSGPLTIEWNLPYSGFIPGQNIPINIEVENLSNDSIEKVTCKIDQETIFKDKHAYKTKKSYKRIAKTELGGVGAHGERTYHDIFTVPASLNPPNLRGCSIMEVHHTLTVEAEMPCCTSDITQSVPITFGHIPLAVARLDDQHIELAPSYNSIQLPSAPIIANAPSAPMVPNMSNMASAPNFDTTNDKTADYNTPSFNPNFSAPGLNPNYNPPPYTTEKPGFGWQLPSNNPEQPPPEYDDAVFVEKPMKA